VRFDTIISPNSIGKMRKFAKLKALFFQDNNIYSFIQISKLEALQSLQHLNIEANEVSQTTLMRTFIVYRFPNVTQINDKQVTDADKQRARQQFQHFDKILSTPTIFSPHPAAGQNDGDQKDAAKNSRAVAKKNVESAQTYVAGIQEYCVKRDQRNDEFNQCWDQQFRILIDQAVYEL